MWAVACSGDSLKAEGEECVASSECAAGLTCDFGASPPVCRPNQTLPDAAAPAPDAPPGTPDAAPAPDAPGAPDAAAPDAPGAPDAAAPDAPAAADAAAPDA